MRLTLLPLALSALTLAASFTPQAPRQAPPVFKSRLDVVTVQTAVRSGGKWVANLTAADFELRDNGVVQELTGVSAEQVPIDLTLLLDVSGSVDGLALLRLKSAVRDTAGLLGAGDRVRLLAVTHVLHEVFGFRSPGEPMPLDLLTAGGATSLYDGLAAAMMRPSEPGRRQLIVAFTDGHDTTSIVDQALAIDIARRTDALVDVVMPPGRGRAAVPDAESSALDALTLPTAGEVLLLDSRGSVSDAFRSLLNDFRAGYLLRYIPRGVTAKGWHEVIVTVTRPGQYDVRARKSYSG